MQVEIERDKIGNVAERAALHRVGREALRLLESGDQRVVAARTDEDTGAARL